MLKSLSPAAKEAYRKGAKAKSEGLSEQSCPHGMGEMLKRNAWLAGHYDYKKGDAVESQNDLIVIAARKYVAECEIAYETANFEKANNMYTALLRAVRAGE